MTGTVTHETADATDLPPGPTILAHVVNDAGAWGAGFVLAVSRRWPEAEAAYRKWHAGGVFDGEEFGRGQTLFVQVAPSHWVAHMVAQRGLIGRGNPHPLHLLDLEVCMDRVCLRARKLKAGVRMPRIGCGLAGGTWGEVGPLVAAAAKRYRVDVTVYDLPTENP